MQKILYFTENLYPKINLIMQECFRQILSRNDVMGYDGMYSFFLWKNESTVG